MHISIVQNTVLRGWLGSQDISTLGSENHILDLERMTQYGKQQDFDSQAKTKTVMNIVRLDV